MRVCGVVDLLEFLFRHFAFFVEIVGQLKLVGEVYGFVVILNPPFFGTQVLYVKFGFTRIVPKIRRKGSLFLVCDFDLFLIDVKDTSSTHQGALQYL
jgi:hypothetical protein